MREAGRLDHLHYPRGNLRIMVTQHQLITRALRDRIADGTYPAGSKIPSIPDLMTEFEVARDTVRDAVAKLAHEGLLTPKQGIGTVVRDTTPITLSYSPGAAALNWDATGGDARDQTIHAGWEDADPDVASRLEVPARTRVLYRVRHMGHGRHVERIREQWVVAAIVDAIRNTTGDDLTDRHAVQSTDIFSQFRAIGNSLTVTEVITARMPDPDETQILELPPGVPVLVLRRVTRNGRGAPLETSTSVSGADRMSHSYTVPV